MKTKSTDASAKGSGFMTLCCRYSMPACDSVSRLRIKIDADLASTVHASQEFPKPAAEIQHGVFWIDPALEKMPY